MMKITLQNPTVILTTSVSHASGPVIQDAYVTIGSQLAK